MSVDPTTYLNALSRGDSAAKASKSMGKEDFLRILTEQLKHQDPFNTMDPSQMIGQLSQFSMLEQLTNMNAAMTSGLSALTLQTAASAVSYIGKTVLAAGQTLSVKQGAATKASYSLPSDAKTLQATIYDKSGALVRTIDIGAKGAGSHELAWDGKDAKGKAVPDGIYTIAFNGTDAKGEKIAPSATVSGEVSGVAVKNGSIVLTLKDGREVNLTDVQSVASGNA